MSTDAKPSNVRELYLQAVRMEDDSARQAFLDQACGSETELRQRVEKLLAARAADRDNVLQRATADSISGRDSLSWDGADLGETIQSHSEAVEDDQTRHDAIRGLIDISTHPMIGNYRLLEELGHGGMGTVYMAQQSKPVKRQVAMKVIKPGMDSKEVIARFEAERQALAMMDHPHIARVLDGGTTDEGRPYFVMELVRGVPITEFCKRKSLPLRQRLELFVDICHAVQHAHQKGIIHRDLKPGNIMITLHDGKPVVKVIDFGVAKALHHELTEKTLFTHFSQMVGTPLYMAPEQAEMSGLGVDTRSDIFSLGVVLYELLTGTTPFDRDTMSKLGIDGIRKLIVEQEPPRPSARISTLKAANRSTIEDQRQLDTEDFGKQLNREVDWIVMKALEKDRERRYDTANAFAADVERYLRDEPVKACPPSSAYRIKKYITRHKGLITVASILVAMLVSATAVSSVFALQANEAKKEADNQREEAVKAKQLANNRLEQSRLDFDRALASMDTIVEEVSSAEFAQLPGVEEVRGDILAKMMGFYEKIIEDHDNDPYARTQRAMAHLKIATLYGFSDRKRQIDELNKAIELLESLVREFPDEFNYEEKLGTVLFARVHAHGRSKEQRLTDAERMLRMSLKGVDLANPRCIAETPLCYLKVADNLPTGSKRAEELVDACLQFAERHDIAPPPGAFGRLAEREIRNGDHQQAIEHIEKCIDGYQQMGNDPKRRTGYIERWLATLHQRELAKVHVTLGNLKEAEQEFRNAQAASSRLLQEYPAMPQFQNAYADATLELIDFLRDTEKPEKIHNLLSHFSRLLTTEGFRSSRMHWIHAKLLRASDDPILSLTKAIESFPEENRYYRHRGAEYREQQEFEKALADADRSVELAEEDNGDVYSSRAETYLARAETHQHKIEDYQKALSDMNRCLELEPNLGYRYKRRALVHFYLAHYDKALADIATAVELTPNDGSNLYWIPPRLVASCPNQDFRDGMLELADQAIENQDIAYNRIGRAELLAAMGRDAEAMRDYDQAIELEPDRYDWRTWRIRHFAERERWENLKEELKAALAIRPESYSQHYQLGLTALVTEETSEYRDACRAMLAASFASLENEDVIESFFVSWTCALAPKAIDDYEPAIQLARRAVEKKPNNQQYLSGLGAILMRTGNHKDAKEQLEKALEADEDDNTYSSYIHYFLAMIEHHLGNIDAAAGQLQTANALAKEELAGGPAWNRRMTLQLLRKEAESQIRPPQGDPNIDAKQ